MKKLHLFSFPLIAIGLFVGYAFLVSAAAPSGGYTPGATLDPDCAPGDTDCVVQSSGGATPTNGLSTLSGGIGLGGILTENTAIDQDGFDFEMTNQSVLDIEGFSIPFAMNFVSEIGQRMGFEASVDYSEIAPVLSQTFIGMLGGTDEDAGMPAMTRTYSDDADTGESGFLLGQDGPFLYSNNQDFSDSSDIGSSLEVSKQGEVRFQAYDNFSGTGEATGRSQTAISGTLFSMNFQEFDYSADVLGFYVGDTGGGFSVGSEKDYFIFDSIENYIRMGSVDNDNWNGGNNGNRSIAIGFALPADILGPGSPAFPTALASGVGSIALGSSTTASGILSLSYGLFSEASGGTSIALGNQVLASGETSLAMGNESLASGTDSIAIGDSVMASGVNSYGFGVALEATGERSLALGSGGDALGDYSVSIGGGIAEANYSIALGGGTASGYNSLSLIGGRAYSSYETAIGGVTPYTPIETGNSYDLADRLFVIGNSFGTDSDAFTILKSGLTGIGIDNFETTADDELFQVGGSMLSTNGDWRMGNTDNYGSLGVDGSGSWYSPTANELLYNGIQDLTGFGLPEINTGYGYVNFATGVAVSSSAISSGFFSNYTDQANDIKAEVSAQQNDTSLYFGNTDNSAFSGFVVDGGGFRFVTEGGQIAQIQKNGDFTLNAYQNCTGFTSTAGGLLQCTASDARLKNIQGDFTSGLDALRILSPQLYTWKDGEYYMSGEYAGFIAQNVEEALPIAVTTDRNGYLNIQDRPILAAAVNAIKELDLSIQDIENVSADDSTFGGMMREWFADATNGIQKLFVGEVESDKVKTNELCLDDLCITKDQLQTILNQGNIIPSPNPVPDQVVPEDPGSEGGTEISPEPAPEPEVITPTDTPEPAPAPDPTPETPME